MEEVKIVSKFGEVTNQKLFQVRGDHHWYISPQRALDEHNKLKQHSVKGK
jgi:hypothetical protein